MKHLRVLGLAVLMIAMLGLSGCDTNNNDKVNNAASVPPAETEAGNDTNVTVISADKSFNRGSAEEEVEIEKVEVPIEPEYSSFPIEASAHALTNNGQFLVYGTVDGLMYSLDVETGTSTFLYDLNENIPNLLIGGLAYIGNNQYFYGAAHNSSIRRLDITTGESQLIAQDIFPDGIDLFNGKIYSVTDDRDETLTIFDMDGNKLGTLSTGIDDFVAIAHSENYLYILSEDSDIYQVDPDTGASHMVVDNSGFEEGDSFGGVEGLDILDHHLYMTNVNDSTIYRVEVDVRAFE